MDEKKKRGRKPKTAEDATKKTTRKSKAVFQTWNSAGGSQLSDDENIVVHLNIPVDPANINNEQNIIESFDDDIIDPKAYNHDNWKDYSVDLTVESTEDSITNANMNTLTNVNMNSQEDFINSVQTDSSDNGTNLKIVKLLKEFEEKNKNKEWPSNTSIACYWCCHKFDTAPIGIPISYQDNRFDVFGCFCSLNCACAFNCSNSKTKKGALARRLFLMLSRRARRNRRCRY